MQPMAASQTWPRRDIITFAKKHIDFISGELAETGRSHLAGLVRRLPNNAAHVLDVARSANARDAAALAATFAAAGETNDPAASLRFADMAMVFGGIVVATELLPLVASIDADVERGGEDLPVLFPRDVAETDTYVRDSPFVKGLVAMEAAHGLTVQRFRDDYFQKDRPVRIVAAGQSEGWAALDRWRQPKYLCDILGHRTVPVEVDGTEEFVPFREVLRAMVASPKAGTGDARRQMYLAQHPLFDYVTDLREDFATPKWTQAAAIGMEGCVGLLVNAWVGGCGTGTKLHFDSRDNILVQVVGVKLVTLFPASDSHNVYAETGENFSPCDLESPNYSVYPRLSSASGTTCILREGDALFMPAGVWHFVCIPVFQLFQRQIWREN